MNSHCPSAEAAVSRGDTSSFSCFLSVSSKSAAKTWGTEIQKITRVTGIIPEKIHFYTADGWKWKIYMKALMMSKAGKLDIGSLIRESFKDQEMKTRTKQVPVFARQLVDDVIKLPNRSQELRLKMGQINEVGILQDAMNFIQGELGVEITIGGESDPWIEDPAKRAHRSKPYRPAIYVA